MSIPDVKATGGFMGLVRLIMYRYGTMEIFSPFCLWRLEVHTRGFRAAGIVSVICVWLGDYRKDPDIILIQNNVPPDIIRLLWSVGWWFCVYRRVP